MIQVLRGATIHPGDGHPAFVGDVTIAEGCITDVLEPGAPAPRGAREHEMTGRHVTPGFIDAHAHLGVWPEGFNDESKDLNEMTSPVTPHLNVMDGVWPGDTAFVKARAAGVTTICILPGSANVIGGTGIVVKTYGNNVERMAMRSPACLKVAFGLNVKHSHGVKANRAPLTRMAIAALFRQAFDDAKTYMDKRARDPEIPRDPGKDILAAAMRREFPVRAHCARSDDILTALRLAKEYRLDLVLDHGYEAEYVLEEVHAAGVPVVLGPFFRTCGSSEATNFNFESTRRLDDAGICVAHMSDHPIVPVEYLTLQAGLCVRAGMSPERALATICHNAARILGLDGRIGRLAPGLDADLVILDGPPLAVETRVLSTWIGGREVHGAGAPIPVPGGAFRA